jgi:hypothetical protein
VIPGRVIIEIAPDPVFAAYDTDLREVVLELKDWSAWSNSPRMPHLARLATWVHNGIAAVISGEVCRQVGCTPVEKVRIEVDLNFDAPREAWELIDRLAAEAGLSRSHSSAVLQGSSSMPVRIVCGEEIGQQCRPVKRLCDAVAHGDPERVRALAKGIDVNSYGYDYGATPLGTAIGAGQIEIAKYLIARGADVNRPVTEGGLTPLAVAVEAESDAAQQLRHQPSTATLELLLGAGADPNAPCDRQQSPLAIAQSYGNLKAAELLLRAGAKANP